MAKTVVFQSYRADNIPGWLDDCLWTVRRWASDRGFEYAFLGDEIFDALPAWFKDKTAELSGKMCVWSDLARLHAARSFLCQGYDRTIWIDADILVFDHDAFNIEVEEGTGFCEEVWLERVHWGEAVTAPIDFLRKKARSLNRLYDGTYCFHRVNNAVSVFNQPNTFLDFYIHSCLEIVAKKEVISTTELGTRFLSPLREKFCFSLIRDVGLFSPLVMEDLASNRKRHLVPYMRHFQHPIHAANLCGSFLARKVDGVNMIEALYERVIERLLDSRGAVVNEWLPDRKPKQVPGPAYTSS